MNSKRRITIVSCALFIMLGFLVNGISLLSEERDAKRNAAEEEISAVSGDFKDSYETDAEAVDKSTYLLKITDGIVVVYEGADENKPLFVTDIYAGTLRNYDRELLSRGITVSGEQALQAIIEDFSS